MRFLNTVLNVTHGSLMILFLVTPFVLDWQWVVAIWLGIELHLILFNGCSITILQNKIGGLAHDNEYISNTAKALFGIDLNEKQHDLISAVFLYGPVLLAVGFAL